MLALSQSDPHLLLTDEGLGDLLKVCTGLRKRGFCWDPREEPFSLAHESERLADSLRADPRALETLIDLLRRFFDVIADGLRFEMKLDGAILVIDAQAIKAGLSQRGGFDTPSTRDGFVQSVVLGTALYCLYSDEAALIRRCKRESCQKVFFATRPKQIFCTRKCASAATFERYKQTLGEEGYREKRREVMRRRKQRIDAATKRAKRPGRK